jgi:hypothetical protein
MTRGCKYAGLALLALGLVATTGLAAEQRNRLVSYKELGEEVKKYRGKKVLVVDIWNIY